MRLIMRTDKPKLCAKCGDVIPASTIKWIDDNRSINRYYCHEHGQVEKKFTGFKSWLKKVLS